MPVREQSLEALRAADAIRLARAQVKRGLRTGETLIADALVDPCCQTARVWTLLCAHHDVGDARATKLLSRCQIGPARRVCDLTARQRDLVVAAMQSLMSTLRRRTA